MRAAVCGFLLGALALQFLPALPAAGWCWLGLACVPGLLLRGAAPRFASAILCGFLWALWAAHQQAGPPLPPDLAGRDLLVTGRVVSLPARLPDRARFELQVDRAWQDDRPVTVPARLRLTWYRGGERLRAGADWQLLVRLKPARGFRNPGGFDYEGWLFRRGIGATGYIRRSDANQALTEPRGWLAVRARLKAAVASALEDHPARGYIVALALGDRSGLTPDHWQVLQRTGTGHLMAISGLHVGLVAALAFALARLVWLLWPGNGLRIPAPRVGAVFAFLAAGVYAALAGFAVPTQRAWIMVGVAALAVLARRQLAPWQAWWVALGLVLLWDPLAVGEAGFWLSFAAVAVILAVLTGRVGRLGRWHGALRVQLAITLGLAPLLALWFGQVSLVSPLANLVAIPVVSLLVVPPTLLGALLVTLLPLPGQLLLTLAAEVITHLMVLLGTLADAAHATWQTAPGWAWVPAVLGVAVLLMPSGMPGRWLSLVLLAPLAIARPAVPPSGGVWFTLLDVGQGLAAVVQTRHHVLVYDTGPRYSERFDTGEAVVVPYLQAAGVRHIDRLIISHGDNDHSGGSASVLTALPVGDVLASDPLTPGGRSARLCRQGQRWTWDGVRFEILHPRQPHALDENDASCVLRVTAGGRRILLPGDVQAAGERQLLRHYGRDLQADVLVAPHHGSATSSTAPFVATVRPRYVLYSAGYRNRFGFPVPEVAARYAGIGARALDTAGSGAILLRIRPDGRIEPPRAYRQTHARFWTAR